MNTEQISQILETIKTLNLNIDSQSAVEIVSTIKPLLWFVLIKDFLVNILGLVAFVVGIYLMSRAVVNYFKGKEKEKEKE